MLSPLNLCTYVCQFPFRLINLVLRDREDSAKKKVLQADFVELYFPSSLSLIMVGFHRCGSSLSFLSMPWVSHVCCLMLCQLQFLLNTFDVIEARICRFLSLKPLGLSCCWLEALEQTVESYIKNLNSNAITFFSFDAYI